MQTTLARTVDFKGVGLHSGAPARMALLFMVMASRATYGLAEVGLIADALANLEGDDNTVDVAALIALVVGGYYFAARLVGLIIAGAALYYALARMIAPAALADLLRLLRR